MIFRLGVVYTMNHEVVPRRCKIYDWLLNSPWYHFSSYQGKNVRVTMEFQVPKRHISRPTLSIDMVQRVLRWERQKRCSSRKRKGPMIGKCCYNYFSMNFFWVEKMNTREWSNLNISKTAFFGHIFRKISTFTFWCMVVPLCPDSLYTQ